MKDIVRFIRKIDRQMLDFIICFITGDIAVMLVQSMIVWTIFERLGIGYLTAIALFKLLLSTILARKYSYLLDKHSRTKAVLISNIFMLAIITFILITDWMVFYILLSIGTSLYFTVLYPARSAIGQAILLSKKRLITTSKTTNSKTVSFKQLNSMLAVTDKIGAILVSMIVATLFVVVGVKWLIILGLISLGLSTVLIHNFEEPTAHSDAFDRTKHNKPCQSLIKPKAYTSKRDFTWYFSHPIAWLSVLYMSILLIVILSGDIDTIYLYEILALTPEMFAYLGIAFNSAAIAGGLLVNYIRSEQLVIYIGFAIIVLFSLIIALFPHFNVFLIKSAVFGFTINMVRVTIGSIIMREIPNNEVATFEGLTTSLRQGLQLLSILGLNFLLFIEMPQNVIWLYPAVFMFVPLLWWYQSWLVNPMYNKFAKVDIRT